MGTPDTDTGATPVSSHTASRNPSGLNSSFESQPKPGGRHLESQTHQGSYNATELISAAPLHHYQARRSAPIELARFARLFLTGTLSSISLAQDVRGYCVGVVEGEVSHAVESTRSATTDLCQMCADPTKDGQ